MGALALVLGILHGSLEGIGLGVLALVVGALRATWAVRERRPRRLGR